MKTRHLLLGAALVAIALVQPLTAATDIKNLTVNATVSARAKLTLGAAAINFADADPDVTPLIPATGGAVTVNAKGRTAAGPITLTVLALGNLTSGSDTIAISNIAWTVTGSGYLAGSMSTATEQNVGSWAANGSYDGSLSFTLVNSWSYVPGNYTATARYTLTAP